MLKVDTKEKFSVVRFTDGAFTANVSNNLAIFVTKQLQLPEKNIIIDFGNIVAADKQTLPELAALYQLSSENNASFVICNIQNNIKKLLDELDLTDVLNITPTESEAWDIVQMEEIERELLGDD